VTARLRCTLVLAVLLQHLCRRSISNRKTQSSGHGCVLAGRSGGHENIVGAIIAVHHEEEDICTGTCGGGCSFHMSFSLTASADTMAAGVCRPRAWAAVSVLAVLAACSTADSASAQVVGVDVTNNTLVVTSAGLAQALRTSNINQIVISCECISEHSPAARSCAKCASAGSLLVHVGHLLPCCQQRSHITCMPAAVLVLVHACTVLACRAVPCVLAQCAADCLEDEGCARCIFTHTKSVLLWYIAADVKLRQSDFRPTIVVNRNVMVAASSAMPGSEPDLDFDHGIDFILVSCAAHAGLASCSLLRRSGGAAE
jgi:hypothetical protein